MTLRAPTCLCGCAAHKLLFDYDAPPAQETRFEFTSGGRYRRQVFECASCGHMRSVHEMSASAFYEGQYVNATYRDEQGMRKAFDRIDSLDPSRSDNRGRVKWISELAAISYLGRGPRELSVLDVGSGLCVFLARMKAEGWQCTALDPDPRAVKFATEQVGVKGLCSDFLECGDIGRHDLITFNKVLEHVEDPVRMLAKAVSHLARGGFVYVELPDGELAAAEGKEREEFFIEHHHVFSMASIALLARRAGFSARRIERLMEPSAKFTLRAWLAGT